jgi:DNA-binding MarR family transcriptional regulator
MEAPFPKSTTRLRALIERVVRLSTAEDWSEGLNPSQRAVLRYLARANRHSRAPSLVAEYLGATRGTVSQTLHALERKGLVVAVPSQTDRRSIRHDLTPEGRALADRTDAIKTALAGLDPLQAAAMEDALGAALGAMLAVRGGRAFGICRDCRHHRSGAGGAHCALLNLSLTPEEMGQHCAEQEVQK